MASIKTRLIVLYGYFSNVCIFKEVDNMHCKFTISQINSIELDASNISDNE
ncbi:hypothetical protein ABE142_05965 [Paenibacillus alvei]|uniref:hypothetical protein n=1 Tax=Paenibacillus alvei TaxID=44250 RepID=UPI003D2E3DF6